MKKNYFLTLLLITATTFSQTLSYKSSHAKKESNYFEIVKQVREELSPLKRSTLKKDIKKIKQFERWAYYWKDRVDAQGRFPSSGLGYYNAGILDVNGKLINKKKINNNNQARSSAVNWVNIGPQSVPEANGYPNNPQMGRLTNFLRYKHQTDENQNVLFVTAPVGGVWKSIDNGATWTPKLDEIAGIGTTDIKSSSSDINNPGVIYVSTGDYDGGQVNSIGVLKSIDFGETFQSTGLSFSLDDKEILSNLIVIDANTVIVGTNQNIKKTTDGGLNWSDVFFHPYNDAVIGKLHRNGTNIMACDSWGGLIFSKDNGNTWTQIKAEGVTGSSRHASTSDASGVFYVQNNSGQISTYNPSQASPVLTNLGVSTTGYNAQGDYNQALVVKDGLIISAGVDAINTEDNGQVWYTTLNNAWQDNNSEGSYGHADIHEIGPLDAGYSFWTVNDGGLTFVNYANISDEKPNVEYKSSGVLVTQLYSVAISPQSENHIIIGNQDNDGYSQEMHNGSLQWVAALAGDGTCTAIDYSNPNIRYLGGQNGSLIRTDTGFSNNYGGTDVTTPATGAPFVWTLKMHSTIPTTLYGGFADVYKTTNKGGSWTNLNSGAGKISYIETFGDNLIVVGENGTKRSVNDGSVWNDVIEPIAGAKINSVSLDQNDNNIIYTTVSGYVDGSKVFKSTNGGATIGNWTNISAGLPNVKMTQIVLKQNQGQEILFVGTEVGVYLKVGSANWEKLGQGLPNVNVSDIEINYTVDKLVAATYGRGLWQIDLTNTALGIDDINNSSDMSPFIYPNPVSDKLFTIKLPNQNKKFDYIIYNVIGGVIKQGELRVGENKIDVSNAVSGIYVVRFTSENYATSQKIIIK
ncbi:T9SS type A sorting domain-containing protein [Tenacibaculum aquimarinum]|uniref:T9SS type A sorting domain-containing protein n=1 Tax=Tenacibaculum aquimarinum TaxID=2910675 RepID=UPI001F0AF4A4|nr:T9SS type A sorting domain-containing protein [Tenacibaculum aquimarinum]MCH3885028.1 T9SS type A sorting domain-containing protein [Tenacibaculum aquimarinum]